MSRDRSSSADTVKAATHTDGVRQGHVSSKVVSLWVHDDAFSKEDVLINPNIFAGLESLDLSSEHLVEIAELRTASEVRDFQSSDIGEDDGTEDDPILGRRTSRESQDAFDTDDHVKCLLSLRPLPAEIRIKHPSLGISITGTIASAFGFRNRSQVVASVVSKDDHTASHVEIGFRDIYLARSDMWSLVESEFGGRTIYSGQRVLFLGTIKATVKNIHVKGRRVNAAYFAPTTVPVFRSEAARYVLFIQMSREMWDFDSEGNGEILFNRVSNGFLPDLFRRWSSLEVKHLVTIVMFGRLEYSMHDFSSYGDSDRTIHNAKPGSVTPNGYEDFYRVVVTDMASAKWTTILDELKRDFRVFLRDISLEHQLNAAMSDSEPQKTSSQVKIRGRLSSAMRGNILEAINIASSQFANDYIDRDLVRTGISVVVITAGSGVFDVQRDLLCLTSENLTNNGIGIDIVCLSRMPLHSAPLFRYPVAQEGSRDIFEPLQPSSNSTASGQVRSSTRHATRSVDDYSSFPSSAVSSMSPGISRVASSIFTQDHTKWHYGIPHWIDLSYWTADNALGTSTYGHPLEPQQSGIIRRKHTKRFIPRVRMYEPQMMGIMELGLANISIPYIRSTSLRARRIRGAVSGKRNHFQAEAMPSPKSFQNQAPGGLLTANARQQSDMIRRMEEYDADVFSPPRKRKSYDRSKLTTKATPALLPAPKRNTELAELEVRKQHDLENSNSIVAIHPTIPKVNKGLLSLLASPQKSEGPRISRSVSYALRGLGAPPRSTASTEINVENIQAQGLLPARSAVENDLANTAGSIRSFRGTETADIRSSGETEHPILTENDSPHSRESPSMPIAINSMQQKNPRKARRISRSSGVAQTRRIESDASAIKTSDLASQSHIPTEPSDRDSGVESEGISNDDSSDDGFKPGSIVQDIPFIRNVNASNPVKYDPNVAAWFGRWQHLYPRKPKAATVKWRSLTTPASVPLTTDEFPGLDILKRDFERSTYVVVQKSEHEPRDIPRTRKNLFADMLALRLAHGYQWVLHSQGQGLQTTNSHDSALLYQRLRQNDGQIYMTMGSTLQSLDQEGEDSVRVTRYRRKPKQDSHDTRQTIEYCPNIRTILSQTYKPRNLKLTGFSEEYPWELADSYLADAKISLDNVVEKLRFWRARFVLIPVEPPATAWRLAQSTSENEEEIHLLGIRALTQMFQRQRYIPPQEKTFSKPATLRSRDLNPLSIIFETLNPSEIVATELDKLLAAEDTGEQQPAQLLPDSELFERETTTLSQLAQAMQGDKGIEIKNRRWHLRLYYFCFLGVDFTNWLRRVFKEGEFHDRNDCVGFGNTLMENGLFTHVNGRHNFKDGNYFYSIAPEYRAHTHRAENTRQSWMGFPGSRRSERSVPATPASERPSKDFKDSPPTGRRSRSGSIMEKLDILDDETFSRHSTEKNRVSISLSKMIPIDLDTRKRSSKAEIVHLYYDRLHNPENCYGFALTWPPMTTSALVENALSTWATQSEKYGLKLVEVPIAEASKVSENEPFRSPYQIRLALQPPPKPLNGNGNFISTSFTPLTPLAPDPHVYHKALLKKHNFVLDHEAAADFPSDVDVLLAWGKLEYTMTQYIHRSGVILAQITDDGSFVLLANRLYYNRSSTKDSNKFQPNTDRLDRTASRTRATTIGQPSMQASGFLGLDVPIPSPRVQPRASADVFGSYAALTSSGMATYITPEQIKNQLETFCQSSKQLKDFYDEVTAALAGPQGQKSSSSILRPIKGPDVGNIPEIRLPDSLVTRKIGEGNVKRIEQVGGSPLSKADTADEISEAMKSPMRGATL